jgi:hypothetical protein
MVQPIVVDACHPIDSDSLPAMGAPLASIDLDLVSVATLGLLPDDAVLRAPFVNDVKIILDLTPNDDDWLTVDGVNSSTHLHHEGGGSGTEALHISVKMNESDAAQLDAIERKIQQCMGYSVIRSQKVWKTMHRGNGKVILNLMVDDDTAAPSVLRFIQGDTVKKGFGRAFLYECLKPYRLQDFVCKVRVELECIHETESEISILLTVHSVIFAPVPKRVVIDFNGPDELAAQQAAKRIKYRF